MSFTFCSSGRYSTAALDLEDGTSALVPSHQSLQQTAAPGELSGWGMSVEGAGQPAGVHHDREQPTAPAVGRAEKPCRGQRLHPAEGAAGSPGELEGTLSPGGQQPLCSWFRLCQRVFQRTRARLSAA